MTPPTEGGVTIALPLTAEQATAIVVVADQFGVEPWEMAVHVLAFRQGRYVLPAEHHPTEVEAP